MRRVMKQLAILVFALMNAGALLAQAWEVFDTGNSDLPSNHVNAIVDDGLGNVWVGTDWGLAKFDGFDWEVFQMDNSPIPENDIRALAVDGQGRLWIGTFIHGLVIKDGNDWTEYNTQNSPMPADQIRCITIDHHDNAWIGTVGGMAWYDGTEWRNYNNDDISYHGLELPGNNIASIAVREDDLVCIGTLNAGFTYLTDSSVTVFTTFEDGLPDNTGLGVALDEDGERWVACPAGGLLRHGGNHQGTVWFQYSTLSSNIPSNSLNDVVIDAYGTRILATQNSGVAFFTGASDWTVYNENNSELPDNVVLTLHLDNREVLWVGTETGGLARFDHISGVHDEVLLDVKLFPSIAKEEVFLAMDELDVSMSFTVLDMSGRVVHQGIMRNSPLRLDVGGLARGTYMVIFQQTAAHAVERFTKL